MRPSGFSLLGLLAILVIVALLAAHALEHSSTSSSRAAPGSGYGSAISAAQTSVARQNAAAAQAQSNLP